MSMGIEFVPTKRKEMVLFYLVDTSGSMSIDSRIGKVNSAIENVMSKLEEISENNDDAEIKIAILEFSTGANWVTPIPVSPSEYVHEELKAGGVTDFGAACKALEEKLHRKTGFMNSTSGAYPPVILLLSDGEPNDQWEKSLAYLQRNQWFKRAIKIAFAIGDDFNRSVLEQFVGNNESIITVNDMEELEKRIILASEITSEFQSQSANVENGNADAGEDSAKLTVKIKGDDDQPVEPGENEIENSPDPPTGEDFPEDWVAFE